MTNQIDRKVNDQYNNFKAICHNYMPVSLRNILIHCCTSDMCQIFFTQFREKDMQTELKQFGSKWCISRIISGPGSNFLITMQQWNQRNFCLQNCHRFLFFMIFSQFFQPLNDVSVLQNLIIAYWKALSLYGWMKELNLVSIRKGRKAQ